MAFRTPISPSKLAYATPYFYDAIGTAANAKEG